jgi:hypothetical protein
MNVIWSEWYGAYIAARAHGGTVEEATEDAAVRMRLNGSEPSSKSTMPG